MALKKLLILAIICWAPSESPVIRIPRDFVNRRQLFLNIGIALPSDEAILNQFIMTDRFKPEEIDFFEDNMRIPGLIVLPPQLQRFSEYESLLNSNTKSRGYFVSGEARKVINAQEALTGGAFNYRFGFGETSPSLGLWNGEVAGTVKRWESYEPAKSLRAPTPKEYVLLQAQAEEVLDFEAASLLCEEGSYNLIGKDGIVLLGGGNYRHFERWVLFFADSKKAESDSICFRPVLVA